MKKIILVIFIFVCTDIFSLDNKFGFSATPLGNISLYYPSGTKSKEQIIEHKLYSLNYLEAYEQANWTFYILDVKKLDSKVDRKNDFREDPMVKLKSADIEDYTKSGYDRGHLVPAADMSISKEIMSETFYFSNMSPQLGEFNRESWRFLELYIRTLAEKSKYTFIYTGPVINKEPNQYKSIGKKTKIVVPDQYYKVVLINLGDKIYAAGFLYNNLANNGLPSKNIKTVSEIEKITGLSFFNCVPDSLRTNLKNKVEIDFWKSIKGF